MKLPKLVPNWRDSYKWVSIHCMAWTFVLLEAWSALPPELQSQLPPELQVIVAKTGLALGILGRLWKQPEKSNVSPPLE